MDHAAVFGEWKVPFVTIGSGTLVAREHASRLIEKIYSNGYYFLGYDAFTVRNGSRQPHMEFSASFSKERQPTLSDALDSLKTDPEEVTHYEFVFSPRI